ncbi:hypothetical protein PTSG_05497 [Salpingoeca rosetta]|uniref:Uncharacterized protein n=1 Tax=Salpingoeca rosetta (strain ATCC 50818 / BSB-021) TaxID=946362 RepID=F2UBD9_SALR5|nr:uncharacterized protein PTSG_05497 [Salpingoeca rosetta]EGD73805.1 hypothetical protein PTSG_05497 [Salpingoeca rosetta]|eukprot:XP_004993368.1 hypothetical protein PTSG_05497 [Salpingoeca rosetta]
MATTLADHVGSEGCVALTEHGGTRCSKALSNLHRLERFGQLDDKTMEAMQALQRKRRDSHHTAPSGRNNNSGSGDNDDGYDAREGAAEGGSLGVGVVRHLPAPIQTVIGVVLRGISLVQHITHAMWSLLFALIAVASLHWMTPSHPDTKPS